MIADEIILSLEIESLEEGGFVATSSELPGLVAQGRTRAETLEIAQDVARKLIESYIEHGDPLPKAIKSALRSTRKSVKLAIPVGISAQKA